MAKIYPGRYTAPGDTDVTVFLIGMRVNRLYRIDRWAPIIKDMAVMQRHLAQHPEDGLLHLENWFGRTTLLLSYWRDPQSIQAFASNTDAPHLEPWRRFMKNVAASNDVGIWHETYVIPAGHSETIYASMPLFGLAAATSHVKIGAGTHRARQRISDEAMARTEPARD